MKDYSIEWISSPELFAVHIGICDALNEPCENRKLDNLTTIEMANNINRLAKKYGSGVEASYQIIDIAKATQSLLRSLIEKGICSEDILTQNIDKAISNLPPGSILKLPHPDTLR